VRFAALNTATRRVKAGIQNVLGIEDRFDAPRIEDGGCGGFLLQEPRFGHTNAMLTGKSPSQRQRSVENGVNSLL